AAQADAERRAAEANRSAEEAGRADDALPAKRPGRLRRWWQFLITQPFSSLTHRILFLNVAGLVALVVGVLLLSQFRAGLIDARWTRHAQDEPPGGSGRNDCRRHPEAGDGGNRFTVHRHRPGPAVSAAARRKLRARRLFVARISHQPGARRTGPAPPRLAYP